MERESISTERIVSLAAGAALILISRRLPSPGRMYAAIGGGLLLYWGASNGTNVSEALGFGKSRTRSGVASVRHNRAVRIEKSIAVHGAPEDVYRVWRNPENFPCFVRRVKSVRAVNDNRSHWIIEGPAGHDLEWESEIHYEKPHQSFAWRTLLNADVNHAGSLHFRPLSDSRTEIRVVLSYEPPGGSLGRMVSRLSGADPEAQIEHGLKSFKETFEAGAFTIH